MKTNELRKLNRFVVGGSGPGERPPTPTSSETDWSFDHDLPSKTRLGRYAVEREVGRGGMGVVYLAEDPLLRRKVAIKVVREDVPDTAVSRLYREAAVAAQLQHPNIVPIHEVASAPSLSGRTLHFIVMDWIEGRTLEAIFLEGKTPRFALLQMFEEVARAVAHAHERGIVHRDLKPSNILVDTAGRVFLTDFGLARSSNFRTKITRTDAVIGTPRYMAPEQIETGRSPLTPCTDVYALGTLLVELLTSHPPFEADTTTGLFHKILSEEPKIRLGPGEADLEAICCKALEKLPSDRYANAGELLEDLRRFREHRPVLARRAGPIERAHRWIRRHQTASLAFIVTLFIAFGIAAGLHGLNRKVQRREAALHEARSRNVALEQLSEAADEIALSGQALDREDFRYESWLHRTGDLMRRIEGALETAPGLAQGYHLRACLQELRGDYDSALADWKAAIRCDPHHAMSHFRMGLLSVRLAFLRSRAFSYAEAQDLIQAVDPMARDGEEGIRTAMALGITFEDESQSVFARSMSAYIQLRIDSAREILQEYLQRNPTGPGLEELHWLAGLLEEHPPARLKQLDRALDLRPGHVLARLTRASTRADQSDFDGAIADYTRALRVQPRIPWAYTSRGSLYLAQGRIAEAFADWTRALEIDPLHAEAHLAKAGAYVQQWNPEAAMVEYDQALRIRPKYFLGYLLRGRAQYHLGNHDKALADWEEARRIFPHSPDLHLELGVIHSEKGDFHAAKAHAESAIQHLPAEMKWRGHLNRANAVASLGDWAEALQDYDRAIQILEEHPEERAHREAAANAYRGRAMIRRSQGNRPGALEDLNESLRLHPESVDARLDLGAVKHELADLAGARAEYDVVLQKNEGELRARLGRGRVRVAQDDRAGAFEDFTAVRCPPADAASAAEALWRRAILWGVQKEHAKALADYAESIRLAPDRPEPYLMRAIEHMDWEEWAEAEEDLDRATERASASWPHASLLRRAQKTFERRKRERR